MLGWRALARGSRSSALRCCLYYVHLSQFDVCCALNRALCDTSPSVDKSFNYPRSLIIQANKRAPAMHCCANLVKVHVASASPFSPCQDSPCPIARAADLAPCKNISILLHEACSCVANSVNIALRTFIACGGSTVSVTWIFIGESFAVASRSCHLGVSSNKSPSQPCQLRYVSQNL